ncbi:MAG: SlyX family protein [Gammaproteobacteria bacterium]|nr:SlyX family protein [Gammaproteobacteria bacterium]MCW8922708.1 SlyX family protein [Gammaproteobacteria bacterium]
MQERVTELEIKLAHMENTIDILDQTVITQQSQIDMLMLKLSILEKKLKAAGESQVAHEKDETPPPHY